VTRAISHEENGMAFTLIFQLRRRIRMFSLIIGIDKYKSTEIPDLGGCKADAQTMLDFLSDKLRVPRSHNHFLADERATRETIITSFQCHLIENDNIQHGDAIIVFYAGYGSQTVAPKGWVSDESNIETICPHDVGMKGTDGIIPGIPDRTVDGLLRRLAFTKGNNIVRTRPRSVLSPF
jgi:hypothetical protein